MSAFATIAIAAAALAGGDIVSASSGAGTPLVGDSCAFGINAFGTFACGAAVESAEAEPAVYTADSRRRIGRRTLNDPAWRIGRERI